MLTPIRHNSPFKVFWNLVILATVLTFSVIITYRVAFHTFRADELYYFLNFLLLVDIGVGFACRVKEGHLRLNTFPEIRQHYLKTWFTIDLLAFLPFELIPLMIYQQVPTDSFGLTLYLALQSFTLIKLLKSFRIFNELQEILGLSPAVKRLLFFAFWFSQVMHLMALGWIMIGAAEANRFHADQYLRALYWVTTTIATIGYGDYYPNHDSNAQIIYTIVVQIFGVGMYTYVIANVSSLVSNLDVARSAYQRHMEEVNAFLRAQKVPFVLQERVRDYYSYLWEQRKSVTTRTVLEDLPPSLSLEILMHQNRSLVERVEVFKGAEEVFIREAVQRLRPRVFLPQEFIVRQGELGDSMYFLSAGELLVLLADKEVARLGPGSIFGETSLVKDERRNASVQAVTYSTGYQLSKQDFQELRQRYPEFDERVRNIVAARAKM